MKKAVSRHQPQMHRSSVLPAVGRIATIIGALGGLFAAVFWIAGRVYTAGYFAAMNIPLYHVTFSAWEYAEVSWFPLVLFSATLVILGSLTAGMIFAVSDWLFAGISSWVAKRFKPKRLRRHDAAGNIHLPAVTMFKIAYGGLISVAVLFEVLVLLQLMYAWGQLDGRRAILERAPQVEIVSVDPQDLGTPEVISSSSNTGASLLYVYKGFRLLTYNGGKYYLFRNIDPITCRPQQVYIVQAMQYAQVNLLPAISIAPQCTTAWRP